MHPKRTSVTASSPIPLQYRHDALPRGLRLQQRYTLILINHRLSAFFLGHSKKVARWGAFIARFSCLPNSQSCSVPVLQRRLACCRDFLFHMLRERLNVRCFRNFPDTLTCWPSRCSFTLCTFWHYWSWQMHVPPSTTGYCN